MSKFLQNNDEDADNDDAKAIAIPQVFSENCQSKNVFCKAHFSLAHENTEL